MALFDTPELEDLFGAPIDDLLGLPELTLEEADQEEGFLRGLFDARPPERRPVVHIPGWDDVIHIVPESFLPQEEQDRRRRRRARNIADSPTPEAVRAIGTVMTFVDDINDALLTASVIARLGSVFYPPLRPFAVGLGTVAEALNIYGAVTDLATPTLGPKRITAWQRRVFRGGTVARAKAATTLARALPTVGETIQILQTTDQLFGVGLSLGPLVGLFQDTIFGLPQGAEFTFQSGIRYRKEDEIFLRQEDQRRAEELLLHSTLGRITRAAGAASWLLALPDGPTFDERADALVLLSLVAELARGFIPESRWEPPVLAAYDTPRPSTRAINPLTAVVIRQLGHDPEGTETYPVEGNPRALTPRQQSEIIAKTAPAVIDAWLSEARSPVERIFTETLMVDLPFRLIRAFEGPGVGFVAHSAPIWRALIDSLELGLLPPKDSSDENRLAYLSRVAEIYLEDPETPTPVDLVRQIFGQSFPPSTPPPSTP